MVKYLSILFLMILFCTTHCYSQLDLRDGFIITVNNDTLYGSIVFRGDIKNSEICSFKTESGQIRDYKPFEVHSYRFKNGKYYISKEVEKKDGNIKIFAEYLIDGVKDLFYYRDPKGFHYLISYNDQTLVELPYEEKIVINDGIKYLYESTSHMGHLKSYFGDQPQLNTKIRNIKKPDYKALINLTKDYHNLVCDSVECIVFNKPKNKFKIRIELVYGGIYYRHDKVYSKSYGGFVYFWLPRANENLYFKTGFLISEPTFKDFNYYENTTFQYKTKLYRIPILLEYIFPSKIIQPKFNLGINVLTERERSGGIILFSAGAGALVKIHKNIFLNLSGDTEIKDGTTEGSFFPTFSYHTGLHIKF